MTRRLRQRIGGETRVRTGRFLDDLLDRITGSDDPVDVRRLLEKHRMGEVYDQVMEEIVWGEVAKRHLLSLAALRSWAQMMLCQRSEVASCYEKKEAVMDMAWSKLLSGMASCLQMRSR